MDRTPFAGLTVVAPDENIYEDGASFVSRNPRLTDYLLRLGAKTHRHNGLPGLSSPSQAPAVAVTEGGFLAPEITLHVGYTLVDADGGETMVSPLTTITTPAAMAPPSAAPGVSLASGGSLPIGAYYYAVAITDGRGGETTLGPAVTVSLTRAQKITLTGLQALRAPTGQSVVVYKSTGGAFYRVIETIADTWVDDGTPCADCTIEPQAVNTTFTEWALDIAVPSAAAQGATSVRIYASTEVELVSPALVATLASGSLTTTMTTTQYGVGSPPPVSMSKGGANLIDPDTELIDWHWKRPVAASALLPAGEPGDVRIVQTVDGPTPYAVGSASAAGPAGWKPLVLFGVGPIGPIGPQGIPGPVLQPKGTYALASGYAQYDAVDHHGSSYWATASAAAGVYPPLAPWVLSAEKGDPGPQGGPGLRWKGEWDLIAGYPIDSMISFGDALWVATGSAIGPGLPPGSGVVKFRGQVARPLIPGVGVSDEIGPTEVVPTNPSGLYGGTPGHIFYFDVVSPGTVQVRAAKQPAKPTWDGYAELYVSTDPNTPILSDDDNAGDLMPNIGITPAAGRYFYVLRGKTTSVGAYHVDISGSAEFGSSYDGWWDKAFTGQLQIASGGPPLPVRSVLDFRGPVKAEDDLANNRTVVTIGEPRGTVQLVTGSLASGAKETGSVSLGLASRVMKIATDKAARVQLYTTATKLAADALRPLGTDPTGDHGLVLEAVLVAGVLSLDLNPQVLASNMDTPPTDAMYYRITNMASAGPVTVTFTRQRLEF